MFLLRKIFYNILSKFSESEQIKNFTGFGLYDKSFIEIIRKIDDPYPYFRGLISEMGFQTTCVEHVQSKRLHGNTKNNFYTLYDMGIGIAPLVIGLFLFGGVQLFLLGVIGE